MTDAHMPPDSGGTPEAGYTLVEMLVSILLASILTAMGLAIVNSFFNAERVVTTSYGNLNQLTPIGTSFQQYIRSAVSPAPTPTTTANPGVPGQPVPPFGTYSPTTGALTSGVKFTTSSLTFFTNIGNKIAKVVAVYNATPATPRKGTFTVSTTVAEPTTCPTKDPTTNRCEFTASKSRTAFRVDDVTNATTPSNRIFTYYLANISTPVSSTHFATCTKTVCDADNIQSVGVDLVVDVNPGEGHSADQETVTYEVSSSSQAFNPAIG